MGLQKRKNNGEFEVWQPQQAGQASQTSNTKAYDAPPPAKKSRPSPSSDAADSWFADEGNGYNISSSSLSRLSQTLASRPSTSASSKVQSQPRANKETHLKATGAAAYNTAYATSSGSQTIPTRPPPPPSRNAQTAAADPNADWFSDATYGYNLATTASQASRTSAAHAPAISRAPSKAGPSTAGTSQLSSQGSQKKASPKIPKTPKEKPEKRGARIKKSCPQNILDRVGRVREQRFFMISRERVEGELKEEFSVLGSTGNVYTVTIDHNPRCTCPDSMKGNHCKHILFIYLKVLQVSYDSGFWYQKALLSSELTTIFAEAPLAPNSVAHPRVRAALDQALGKAPAAAAKDTGKKKRLPGPGDDCPICYEEMKGVEEKKLTFCGECGNALHNECFDQWRTNVSKDPTKALTCVWCRANWAVSNPGQASGANSRVKRSAEGYLNLATVAGLSPVRDTSSYYQGPRRGRAYYGYQDYLD